jgi:hypothetical protein
MDTLMYMLRDHLFVQARYWVTQSCIALNVRDVLSLRFLGAPSFQMSCEHAGMPWHHSYLASPCSMIKSPASIRTCITQVLLTFVLQEEFARQQKAEHREETPQKLLAA